MDGTKFAKALVRLTKSYGRDLPAHISEDPGRVVIGCILSARTRDERTDQAYASLFSTFPSLDLLCAASIEDLENLIKPVNFYRTKARKIKEAACYMLRELGGRIPRSRKELMAIPGIGPKCADIVLSYAWGMDTVAVDTHVETVSKRLGVAPPSAKYEELKYRLERLAPPKFRSRVNDLFVVFGREVCTKSAPKCWMCPIYSLCEWKGKYQRKRKFTRQKR